MSQNIATYIVIDGVDFSGSVLTSSFPETQDMHEDTVMSDSAKSNFPGLPDVMASIDGLQSYGVGSVDEKLSALKAAGAPFTIEWRPTSAAVAPTNPKRTATFFVENYDPMSGKRGDLAMFKCTFRPGGSQPNVVRATS